MALFTFGHLEVGGRSGKKRAKREEVEEGLLCVHQIVIVSLSFFSPPPHPMKGKLTRDSSCDGISGWLEKDDDSGFNARHSI